MEKNAVKLLKPQSRRAVPRICDDLTSIKFIKRQPEPVIATL
jgi:hypothetical protein